MVNKRLMKRIYLNPTYGLSTHHSHASRTIVVG